MNTRTPIAQIASFLALLLTASLAHADVKPNGIFGDGAVLQQGIEVPVWGIARDGEKVTVKFQDQTVSTTAKGGRWLVKLKALKAGGPETLTITGDNTLTYTNVLVGEVWLCSGQSNMGFKLIRAENAKEVIAAAADPMLRLYTVPRETADAPRTDVVGNWVESTPMTASNFSAVAYFFGRDLRTSRKVPVGLIDSSVGGTPAEAWTSREALEADPELKLILDKYADTIKNYDHDKAAAAHKKALDKYRAEAAAAKESGKEPPVAPKPIENPSRASKRPSCLYNAMIAPLEPYAMAGVIWYQGEANAARAEQYQTLFPAMIKNWRAVWHQGDFPFLFVQIAPYAISTPEIREAQLLVSQKVPHTAMAVTLDVGEQKNIHPVKKEPVGARLALAARALAYGEKIEYSGPVYSSAKFDKNHATLSFTHVGGGLASSGGDLKGFTIAGEDGSFVPAKAAIEGDKVVVSADTVEKPAYVRYGWSKFTDANLVSKAGLPASSFRTDVKH